MSVVQLAAHALVVVEQHGCDAGPPAPTSPWVKFVRTSAVALAALAPIAPKMPTTNRGRKKGTTRLRRRQNWPRVRSKLRRIALRPERPSKTTMVELNIARAANQIPGTNKSRKLRSKSPRTSTPVVSTLGQVRPRNTREYDRRTDGTVPGRCQTV